MSKLNPFQCAKNFLGWPQKNLAGKLANSFHHPEFFKNKTHFLTFMCIFNEFPLILTSKECKFRQLCFVMSNTKFETSFHCSQKNIIF